MGLFSKIVRNPFKDAKKVASKLPGADKASKLVGKLPGGKLAQKVAGKTGVVAPGLNPSKDGGGGGAKALKSRGAAMDPTMRKPTPKFGDLRGDDLQRARRAERTAAPPAGPPPLAKPAVQPPTATPGLAGPWDPGTLQKALGGLQGMPPGLSDAIMKFAGGWKPQQPPQMGGDGTTPPGVGGGPNKGNWWANPSLPKEAMPGGPGPGAQIQVGPQPGVVNNFPGPRPGGFGLSFGPEQSRWASQLPQGGPSSMLPQAGPGGGMGGPPPQIPPEMLQRFQMLRQQLGGGGAPPQMMQPAVMPPRPPGGGMPTPQPGGGLPQMPIPPGGGGFGGGMPRPPFAGGMQFPQPNGGQGYGGGGAGGGSYGGDQQAPQQPQPQAQTQFTGMRPKNINF